MPDERSNRRHNFVGFHAPSRRPTVIAAGGTGHAASGPGRGSRRLGNINKRFNASDNDTPAAYLIRPSRASATAARPATRRRVSKSFTEPSRDVTDKCNPSDRAGLCTAAVGTLHDLQAWQLNKEKIQEGTSIAIHVTPPDGEEDDEFAAQTPPRVRRKLSTPLAATLPSAAAENAIDLANHRSTGGRSLSALDRTKRRFSTMVTGGAAAAVSRRLSATIGWCLAAPGHVKPHIVRQGRALCMQYIRCQIRRSTISSKKMAEDSVKIKTKAYINNGQSIGFFLLFVSHLQQRRPIGLR
ncbi:hypothetical protein EVAR_37880_1 [Eumeta japonica]|uniref:Uncharacterized protein n=1 Tax=Eumeta variegata TaxID=151549 RepID=A0A4C1Y6B2_EUMVA|nr:hypothetical protein EVAR_37880_1 [Eumeta japonica]